jgi:hypothetical protein
MFRPYCDSPEDGPKGPKHVVSEIVENTSIKTLSCDCRCMFNKAIYLDILFARHLTEGHI